MANKCILIHFITIFVENPNFECHIGQMVKNYDEN